MVSCVTGDICKEVIEDPALDEMWEAAKMGKGYQSVAETIKKKIEKNCNCSKEILLYLAQTDWQILGKE